MADGGEAFEWDFATLVAWWNLYGLPVLLLAVAVYVLVRRRSRLETTAGDDPARTVRRIGLIHCLLALQALISLIQELLTLRTMGIPESHIRLAGASIGTVVNPFLGVGLLLSRPLARWSAIAWYAISALIATVAIGWLWRYGVMFDLATWPEQLVSKIMPFYLLVVMFLPQTRRVFTSKAQAEPLGSEPSDQSGEPAPKRAPAGSPIVSLLTRWFLIVVCSNLFIDVADWVYRLCTEPEPIA
jgi:hypothetical protein